jgi:hypothetical protein
VFSFFLQSGHAGWRNRCRHSTFFPPSNHFKFLNGFPSSSFSFRLPTSLTFTVKLIRRKKNDDDSSSNGRPLAHCQQKCVRVRAPAEREREREKRWKEVFVRPSDHDPLREKGSLFFAGVLNRHRKRREEREGEGEGGRWADCARRGRGSK